MNGEELTSIGHALWGMEWKTVMSERLGFNHRTIRRWANDAQDIPDDVAFKLRAMKTQLDAMITDRDKRKSEKPT